MTVDFIIVGQGLVGSLFALSCLRKNNSIVVVDAHHKASSTAVAAGIMNPITGKRLSRTWEDSTQLQRVLDHYRLVETQLGESVINSRRLIKFLTTNDEYAKYQEKKHKSGYKEYLGNILDPQDYREAIKINPFLALDINPVYQLDTESLLKATKDYLIERNVLKSESLSYDDIQHDDQSVRWKSISAKYLVFCEGHQAVHNPFFNDLSFKNAKGEILEVRLKDFPENTIYNHGKWFCPIRSGLYRYGTSSYWDFKDDQPDMSRCQLLENNLDTLLSRDYTVHRRLAGIRPCLTNRKTVYGFHPKYPRLAILNGLAGQGTFRAPLVIKAFEDRFQKMGTFNYIYREN